MTPCCYQEMCWCSHGFAPVNLRQAWYQQTIISWLYFGVFLAIFVGCIWNTRVIAPLWSYPCCLLVLATSSYVGKDVSSSAFGIYSPLCSVHLALTAQVNWTEHFSLKVQWLLEWELMWGLPVATSPGERWCPPMTCHPEQDDGWIPPWRAQHWLKDVFQNPHAEIFSKGNPF